MKNTMLALLCAAAAMSAVTSAQASGGCGPYAHRGPWGGCRPWGAGYARPYYRPGVYVGVPRIGIFYGGRGWWDGHRYWGNRYRYGGGWRYR